MLLKLYGASGVCYPLADIKDAHILHKENGCDRLIFKISLQHPLYPEIQEESKIIYGQNKWLVKKIQDDVIECDIDFDFLKETVKHNYKYSNQLVSRVLLENLPEGWTVVGADSCSLHRSKTYEHCTPFEVIYDCIGKYDIRLVWNTVDRILTVRVPTKIEPQGVYLSDQLNLKTLTFQGSTEDFATRLYPYGKDGITVASVNGGKEYIEDKTYSDKTVCAYWVDERYEDAMSLLTAAYDRLSTLAKPERSYECKVEDIEQENADYSHLRLKMHDKVTLMVSERKIRVVYSIVEYDEYPDQPESNTVTLSCVPETIQSYTQALVEARVEDAIVVAEKALERSQENAEEIESIEQELAGVEGTVDEVSEKADDAFNKAETAMLEAETADMNVKDIVKGLAVPSDAYFCGDTSPTYGRTYENAVYVMEAGIIYVPTRNHNEHFEETEEHEEIECSTPVERASGTVETVHDAGAVDDDRTGAEQLDAETPPRRIQIYGSDFKFSKGKAYVWRNGGWGVLCDVLFSEEEASGAADGDLWFCEQAHTSDGVEYEKDTVYRWSVKDDSTGGLWVAKVNKTDSYVYRSIESAFDAVVTIATRLTDDEGSITMLSAWKTEATQTIADLTTATNANTANISALLTFMGDSEHGAIKAIADLELEVDAHDASISALVSWMGDSDSGAIKAIADVTAKANANEAEIETITAWIGDSNSGATKAIADVTQKAAANEASILVLTTWKNSAAESIATLQETTNAQGASISALAERVTDAETNIATVTAKADDNEASIQTLSQTVLENSASISEITQTTTDQGAAISTLVQRTDENDASIAQIIQTADEQGAAILAIVTNDEKSLALAREKYVVGKKSPTYGYTYQLACGIVEVGTLYAPSITHSEPYAQDETETLYEAGTPSDDRQGANVHEAGFTDRYSADTIDCRTPVVRAHEGGADILFSIGFCYRWNGDGWVKTKPVSLYTDETDGQDDELWYCTEDISETDEATGISRTKYTAGTLYCWIGAAWVAVADICKNYAQMAAATIEAQVDSITARVQTAEGNLSALQLRVDSTDATVTALAQWKTSVQGDVSNIASISAKADANEAAIALKADKTAAISRADVYYALSTSNTTAPTTGWQTSAPTWESGKYMWQKTVCTYGNGSTSESAATCISGAKGDDGTSVTILGSYATLADLRTAHPTGSAGDSYLVAGDLYVWSVTNSDWEDVGQIQGPAGTAGVGVASITDQYYLSTSNVSPQGGSWSETCPAWVDGKYIWTRSYIVWTDGTNSATTPTLAQALNSFGASIKLNSDAILLKVNAGSIISTINQSAESVTISAAKINLAGLITAINAQGQTTTIDGSKITTGTITATQIDATNLHVSAANIDGTITAGAIRILNAQELELFKAADNTVTIGGFTVSRDYSNSFIYSGKTSLTANTVAGVYVGTNGITVGDGNKFVTLSASNGKLTANNAEITGTVNATAGTIGNLSITGKLQFGSWSQYYIDANANEGDYFIVLPGFSVNEDGATFGGTLNAPAGTIGGFTIEQYCLRNGQNSYDGDGEQSILGGVYIGTDGIGLGHGAFYVTSMGAFTATQANITGTIYANAGTLQSMTITGRLFFGNSSMYYIDANENDTSYYINLPQFNVNDSGAWFGGTIEASTGNIGGFTIASSKLYAGGKTAYNSSTTGVYLGTDGIGLGAGSFYVTSNGYLKSSSGNIAGFTISSSKLYTNSKTAYDSNTSGVYVGTDGIGLGAGAFYVTSAGALHCSNIEATGGTLSGLTVSGRLYFGNNSNYYIDANQNDASYYIYLPGFRVDDASGAVFSGRLSAPSGTIGGFSISTSNIHSGSKTSYNSNTSGVYVGTDGIGLGAGAFYVTSAGALYATDATISGVISNSDSLGWGVKIIQNRIEFYQNDTKVSEIYGASGYYNAAYTSTGTALYISSMAYIAGDLRLGKNLGISDGNAIYVSGKPAVYNGKIHCQTESNVKKWLVFKNGLLVGVTYSDPGSYNNYSTKTSNFDP